MGLLHLQYSFLYISPVRRNGAGHSTDEVLEKLLPSVLNFFLIYLLLNFRFSSSFGLSFAHIVSLPVPPVIPSCLLSYSHLCVSSVRISLVSMLLYFSVPVCSNLCVQSVWSQCSFSSSLG